MALDVSYTYDGAGNRLTATDNLASTTTTYTYDAANQLSSSDDGSVVTGYVYDQAGNLESSIPNSGPTITNTWDDENRLTKVETDSVTTQTAEYNGDGLRVKKVTSAGTRKFIWDGQTYLAETDENDVTQVRYTQRPGPYGDLISQNRGGTSSSEWFHYDALGSTVNVTDINESIPETYEYDAWGKLLDTYSFLPPFLYVGRLGYYYDSATSDYYVRARTYSPVLARWLSRDSIGFAGGVNMYVYVDNRPITHVDASGLILAAIDGSDSRNWYKQDMPTDQRYVNGIRGHVVNFYRDYGGRPKAYWHGPNILGTDTAAIARGVKKWVCEKWCKNMVRDNSGARDFSPPHNRTICSSDPIDLIGHSRGGIIAMTVASSLELRGCFCKNATTGRVRHVWSIPVRFLGLYDPVDMSSIGTSNERIPSNVEHAAVVFAASRTTREHPAWTRDQARSRPYFNRADGGPRNPRTTYNELYLFGTHAAIGGNPWDGDFPVGHSEQNDIRVAIRADQFIRGWAIEAGVPVQQRATASYGYRTRPAYGVPRDSENQRPQGVITQAEGVGLNR